MVFNLYQVKLLFGFSAESMGSQNFQSTLIRATRRHITVFCRRKKPLRTRHTIFSIVKYPFP